MRSHTKFDVAGSALALMIRAGYATGMLLLITVVGPGVTTNVLADESMMLFRSPHFLGRGDAGVASADYQDAIYYNPAGLAEGTGLYKQIILASPTIEVSSDTEALVRQLAIEKKQNVDALRQHLGKNQHVGVSNFTGIILRRAALGVLASNQTNLLTRMSPTDSGLEEASANSTLNGVATFSYADSFLSNKLLLGTTIKYVMREQASLKANLVDASDIVKKLDEKDVVKSGTGFGADFGLIYKLGGKAPVNFGLQVENVGTTRFQAASGYHAPKSLPAIINVGFAVKPQTRASNLTLNLDYRDVTGVGETDTYKKIHVGAQLDVYRIFGLCTGLNQGYPTFGIFMDTHFLRIDGGMYTEEVGDRIGIRPDQRFYISIAAGL